MPMHEYQCETCWARFDELKQFGSHVQTTTCACGAEAQKVWGVPQVRQDIPPRWCEQLGRYVGSRAQEKDAIKEIYEQSSGKLAIDWH